MNENKTNLAIKRYIQTETLLWIGSHHLFLKKMKKQSPAGGGNNDNNNDRFKRGFYE